MNYNVGAYIIYLVLMIFIIVYVGRYFYTHGKIFILSLLHEDEILANQLNKLLLLAYYLFNIGYSFLKLKNWQKVPSLEAMISSLSINMGILILILACTHYLNMLGIYFFSKSKNHLSTNKTIYYE